MIMDLNKANQWLTLAANLGVIAGIIFLGLEVRQNTQAQLAESRQQMMEADLSILSHFIEYPQIILNTDASELPDTELARMQAYWLSMLRSREFAWSQYMNGGMDLATWRSYLEPMFSAFETGLARDYLKSGRYDGNPEFKAYLLTEFANKIENY
jgi:hypothetical protein